MSNKKEEKKSINDMIIEEAVKQFKEGKIQNSLDVESYLDGLLTGFEEKMHSIICQRSKLTRYRTNIKRNLWSKNQQRRNIKAYIHSIRRGKNMEKANAKLGNNKKTTNISIWR